MNEVMKQKLAEIFKRPVIDKKGYRVSYKDVLFGSASGRSFNYQPGDPKPVFSNFLAIRDDAKTECYFWPSGIISYDDYESNRKSISDLDAFFNGKMIFRNADVSDDQKSLLKFDGPCFSFTCLARFFGLNVRSKRGISSILKLLEFVEIVDFTQDQISETHKPGFTRIGRKYHKAGSVLIKVPERWSASGNRPLNVDGYYLLGFDDGQYFGCELPHKVDSLKAAYESLMPSVVRGKKGVCRQGEWFFVPVKEKDVPSGDNIWKFFGDSFCLPQDDAGSNIHNCVSHGFVGEVRVDLDNGGIYMRNVRVFHNEHKTLKIRDWHRVYKNLALRSFSVDGVD